MMQPMARVVKIEYRDQNPKVVTDTSAFVLHFRAPDGELYEHPLANTDWTLDNPTLQFMAKHNFKPSDINGTSMGVKDWQWLIPVVPDQHSDWLLAQNAMNGARAALQDAEWFAPYDGEEATDDAHSDVGGGGDGGDKGGGTVEIDASENDGVGMEVSVQ